MARTVGLLLWLALASGAAAAEWRQIFDVLEPTGDQEAAWARVEVVTPESRAWAYASIIDRLSLDPTTIPVQEAR